MTLITYKVLLTLKLQEKAGPRRGGQAYHPSTWAWDYLLDLVPGESVSASPFPNLDDPKE